MRSGNLAREVFDLCVAQAKQAVTPCAAYRITCKIDDGRSDPKDFADSMLAWEMAVLALRESGFTATFVMHEQEEPHEMAGGVYTPLIDLSWGD